MPPPTGGVVPEHIVLPRMIQAAIAGRPTGVDGRTAGGRARASFPPGMLSDMDSRPMRWSQDDASAPGEPGGAETRAGADDADRDDAAAG